MPTRTTSRVVATCVAVAAGTAAVGLVATRGAGPVGAVAQLAASTSTSTPSASTSPGAAVADPDMDHGGGVGTVTGISGTTITLRTIDGTLSVTTTSSTTYRKEQQSASFATIQNGDVVDVRGQLSTDGKTVAATAVDIEVPRLGGRVQSVSGNQVTVVSGDGALEYITTSSSTKYYANGASSTAAGVTVGALITAEGSLSDLTHLTADDIVIGGGPGGGHGGPGGGFDGHGGHGGPGGPGGFGGPRGGDDPAAGSTGSSSSTSTSGV